MPLCSIRQNCARSACCELLARMEVRESEAGGLN